LIYKIGKGGDLVKAFFIFLNRKVSYCILHPTMKTDFPQGNSLLLKKYEVIASKFPSANNIELNAHCSNFMIQLSRVGTKIQLPGNL